MARRYRKLYVSPQALAGQVRAGVHHYEVIDQPVPDAFKVVGAQYCNDRHAFCVVLESDAFDDVPADGPIPELVPTLRTRE
jgi:hypothetical protein